MLKIFKEIKAVGLSDWLWFVVRLRRNEFHKSLDLNVDLKLTGLELSQHYNKLGKKRELAHSIDLKLSDIR